MRKQPMPDGAPIPDDVLLDGPQASDRTIGAIARRVYDAMKWTTTYDHLPISDRGRFESALARELQPVRRVREVTSAELEWVQIGGKWFGEMSSGPIGFVDLPPAYVGRAPLDVKVIAAELYAAWWGREGVYGPDRYAGCDADFRQRVEAAIQRLMMPEAPKAEPATAAEHIAAAVQSLTAAQKIVGADMEAFIRVKAWSDVRDCTAKLEVLGEALDLIADSEFPW